MRKYDWSDLRELYVKKRLSGYEIARIKGSVACVVYDNLKKQAIPVRNQSVAVSLGHLRCGNDSRYCYNWTDLEQLYILQQLCAREIAELKGCHREIVQDELRRQGIKRTKSEVVSLMRTKISPYNWNDLYKLYIEEQLSSYEIAKIKGCGRSTIRRHLRKQGIPIRQEDPERIKRKRLQGRYKKPNLAEKALDAILNEILPSEYKFVGNGEVIIGGKFPDFININGKKKIIELFGVPWHPLFDVAKRTTHFAKYGFDTLVIWDDELRNSAVLKKKIKKFHRSGH